MKQLSLASPHAIVMVGLPGSGKTFFAEKFAETFHAPYIEQAWFEQYITDPASVGDVMMRLIDEFAKTKQSLVLELNTESRTARTEITRILKQLGYSPLFVWVQVDEATAQSRSIKAGKLSAEDHAYRVNQFSPPHSIEKPLVISGKHTYASQAKMVLKKLSGDRAERTSSPIAPPAPRSGNTIIVR